MTSIQNSFAEKVQSNEFLKDIEIKNQKNAMTAIGLVAVFGLSACGGGGGSASTAAVLNTGTQTDSNSQPSTNPTGAVTDVSNNDVGSTGATGGVGGGGGGAATPAANSLTLTRSGSDYSTSNLSGFTLLGTDSHYQVADAANDSYSITLTASGAGMLTFEFVDAADTVTLEQGSNVTGFSQLKVIRGTVDVSSADMGSVTYVSVASSVKLTAAQVLDLDAIVVNAASGSVEVVVQSQAEIDQITNALSSGNLNLFSPANDLMTLEAAPGASVSDAEIAAGQTSFNSEKRPISEIDEAVIISINGSGGGLTADERASNISVNVFPDAGSNAVSAKVDGIDVGAISNDSFSFSGSGLTSGFHTLSVTTQNSSGIQTVTQQEFLVVGNSNSGNEMFTFKSSKVGDVVTVEAYVKNLHAEISDGIRSYDFWINLDENKLDYIEGSFSPASGSTNAGAENTTNGEIFANGYFQSPWVAYDNALFTFQAREVSSASSMTIEFLDFDIYRTDFGDFEVSVVI